MNIARIEIPLVKSSFTILKDFEIQGILDTSDLNEMHIMLSTKEYGWILLCKVSKTYKSDKVIRFYSPRMILEEDLTIAKIGVYGIGFTAVSLSCLEGDTVQFMYEVQR